MMPNIPYRDSSVVVVQCASRHWRGEIGRRLWLRPGLVRASVRVCPGAVSRVGLAEVGEDGKNENGVGVKMGT